MLCPDCKCAAPGGTPCPSCGQKVPERESFGGQGGHYLRVLSVVSLSLVLLFLLLTIGRPGTQPVLSRFHNPGWLWLYLLIFFIPIGVALYYWALLREEEIVVTDEYIARRSYWGDEYLTWSDVREFRRKPMLFRQTRLGRVTGLSRLFTNKRVFWNLPPTCHELVSSPGAHGIAIYMQLEPGTIDDMPWLLQLIEERVGPPVEG